jgi:hypothetical protein
MINRYGRDDVDYPGFLRPCVFGQHFTVTRSNRDAALAAPPLTRYVEKC